MIDSHCHLTNPRLFDQLDAVLQRALAAGVTEIVTIGTDPDDASASISICEQYSNVKCAIGIHPNESQNWELSDVNRIEELARHPSVIGIGEMGLDYFHQYAPRDRQRAFFEAQLDLATRLEMPVVIHSREAIADTLAVLKNFPNVRCVFHCFTGTTEEAQAILDAGYLLGFDGPITFKKNDQLREVVKLTPLDRILVETDSPYLSPEPVRSQKICEPGFVSHTLAMVAQVKGMLVKEVDEITTKNTRAFYKYR